MIGELRGVIGRHGERGEGITASGERGDGVIISGEGSGDRRFEGKCTNFPYNRGDGRGDGRGDCIISDG